MVRVGDGRGFVIEQLSKVRPRGSDKAHIREVVEGGAFFLVEPWEYNGCEFKDARECEEAD